MIEMATVMWKIFSEIWIALSIMLYFMGYFNSEDFLRYHHGIPMRDRDLYLRIYAFFIVVKFFEISVCPFLVDENGNLDLYRIVYDERGRISIIFTTRTLSIYY